MRILYLIGFVMLVTNGFRSRLVYQFKKISKFSMNTTASDEIYSYHTPVLLHECCDYLDIKEGGVYVDCTLGGGGHTREILERGGNVVGFDQDPDAIAKSSALLDNYIQSGRLEIIQANFRHIVPALKQRSTLAKSGLVDGVLMDLGISSHQIDEPSRGFAFGQSGPLDMRMGQGTLSSLYVEDFSKDDTKLTNGFHTSGLTAATIINEWDTDRLANVLYDYGEETRSRQFAREIVLSRPLNTTQDLVNVISRLTSFKNRPKSLAKCFQALRIAVNDELNALDEALLSVHKCIRPKGRLVIISYHSLEDRRVKKLFRTGAVVDNEASISNNPWRPIFKRAQIPSEDELVRNRRSRSAKLRVAERLIAVDEQNVTERKDQIGDESKLRSKPRSKSFLGIKQLAKLSQRDRESE